MPLLINALNNTGKRQFIFNLEANHRCRIEVDALKLRAKNLEERIEVLETEKRDATAAHQSLENDLLSTKVNRIDFYYARWVNFTVQLE